MFLTSTKLILKLFFVNNIWNKVFQNPKKKILKTMNDECERFKCERD